MPTTHSSTDGPVINAEADRALLGIIRPYGLAFFLMLLAATFAMAVFNLPNSPFYASRRFLDALSILLVMTPFFLGINRLFAMRLRIGRDLVQKQQWAQAIAALDPFAGPSQRFLDSTGEAHYWLSRAYAGVNDTARAEATRAFVLKYRRGPWAQKLQEKTSIRPMQEKRPRPSKSSGRKRRF